MSNDKQAHFLKLYEPIHDRFERFCRARVYGDMDYEDLMNETLLRAYSKLDTLQSETAFLSFLFSISVRVLANQHRKKKPERIESDLQLRSISDQGATTDLNTEITILHEALALLPDAQREALILFEISGFSLKETAELQEVSLSAVKQRLKRGRERLKQLLTFESDYKTGEVNHER